MHVDPWTPGPLRGAQEAPCQEEEGRNQARPVPGLTGSPQGNWPMRTPEVQGEELLSRNKGGRQGTRAAGRP